MLPGVASTVMVTRRCAANVVEFIRISKHLGFLQGAAKGCVHCAGCETLRFECDRFGTYFLHFGSPQGAAIGRFHEDGCEALRLDSH